MRGKWILSAAMGAAMAAFGLSGVALAQPAAAPAAAPDQPDNATTTAVLTPGAPISGVLSPAGDKDWFKLTVAPGQLYRIALDGAGADGVKLDDPLLILHAADGTELARNDDGPNGLNSLLNYAPQQAGTVYVEARGFGDDAQGAYTLSVTASAIPPDNAGNDVHTRARLPLNQDVSGALEYGGDTDWFRLSVRTGQMYRITLNAAGADGAKLDDPLLILHGADGTEIARNDDAPAPEGQGDNAPTNLNSQLDYVPAQSGDVFVEARGFSEDATGGYTLRAQASPLPPDDFSNSRSTRGRLAVGGNVHGNIDYGSDIDWFKVTLTGGQTYRFSLKGDGAHALADPVLRLIGSDGTTELATDDDSGGNLNSYLEFTPTRSGDYYLEAHSFDNTQTGGYVLSAALGDIPDNVNTDAVVSADGETRSGTLAPAGDKDWYRVDLKAGQTIRVALNTADSNGLSDPLLIVHGPDGAELARDDDGGGNLNSYLEFTAPSAGAYFLEARGFGDDATGNYDLVVTAGEIPGQAEGAETLTIGSSGRTSIINPRDDSDWFEVDLVEGRPYRFNVESTPSAEGATDGLGDPMLTLYDSNGHVVASDDDGGTGKNSYLYYASPTGGTYYAAVSSSNHGSTGRYTIRVQDTDVPGTTDTDEALTVATAGSHDGRASRIEIAGDLDMYRVDLVAGVHYVVTVSGDGDTPLTDPFLTILDSTGKSIATDDDSGPGLDSRLVFTPAETGTYYLQASGLSGGVGGYKIAIARQ
ncbi:MAG: PPC domain-containing protein [Alphaproteobacteria bacterium]